MGGTQFDRQVFVAQRERPPRHPSSIMGPLLLLVIVGLVGFGAYKYVQANGVPDFGTSDSQLAQLTQKIDELEQRLERIEKRRKARPAESSATANKQEPASRIDSSRPSSPLSRKARAAPAPKQRSASSAPVNPPTDKHLSKLRQELGSLRHDVAAGREAWVATTDRLGDTIGELGSQRREIARNQERLVLLWDRFDRIQVPFQVRKKRGQQRVGPIFLSLRKTDRKNQRYTMRLLVNDKWVEMKDRALHEPVEFYLSDVSVPLELVVSEIGKNQVVGYLLLPEKLLKR